MLLRGVGLCPNFTIKVMAVVHPLSEKEEEEEEKRQQLAVPHLVKL